VPDRLFVEEEGGQVSVRWLAEGQLRPEAPGEPEPFASPLTEEELEDLRWYLEDYLRAPYAVYEDRGREIEARLPELGERLFDSLFGQGKAGRDAYLRGRESSSWELWLASSSPEFLSLPWELLRDPKRGTPLALDLAGVHRTIESQDPPFEARSGETLKVLMVIARPYGPRDVPYRTVARPLLERLKPVAGKVELEVLRPPTFDRLKERLREAAEAGGPFQILHFDGHGSFQPAVRGGSPDPLRYGSGRQEGVLLFETETGGESLAGASELAPVLRDAGVPLLVLNACQSGMVGGASPEASVATRLLQGGAAAVVAMGYSVYAVAAAEFMAAFYESLFRGEPVTRAVTAGRRQLHRSNQRPSPKGLLPLEDWAVPVHYGRREVRFPNLERKPREGTLTLEQALEAQRKRDLAAAAGNGAEGVHQEGDLSPAEGRFFGRDREFQLLETALRTEHVVLLRGVGGVGKTELAKAFGRWLRASGGLDHPDLVFFHSFEPGIPSFGLDGVVSAVGLRLFGADFARLDAKNRVEAVLGALRSHRILLIWDNFESVHSMTVPGQATPSLDEEERGRIVDFLDEVRKGGTGGVIITSRSPEAWLGEEIHRVPVEGLSAEDQNEYAEALLVPYPAAKAKRETKAYGDLLEFLGGNPFSLKLILPRLADEEPEAILAELRGEEKNPFLDLGALDETLETGGRSASRDASVHYSLRHLSGEDRERLPGLTLFEGVADVDVLGILAEQDTAPERFRGTETEDWRALAGRCVEIGLLTDLGAGMFRIHPALPRYLSALWRQLAGEEYETERMNTLLASITAHAALGQWLDQQIRGGEAATAFTVLKLERRSFGAAAGAALDQGLYAEAQAILEPLNELRDNQGLQSEARSWVDRCREVLEDAAGEAPDLETPAGALWLFMVGSEANRAQRAGRLDEAEAEHDRVRRALEGNEDERSRSRLGVAYHQLGMVAQERGDLSSAERWYRQSLEILESLGNRLGMAGSYHQLGIVAQLRGDLESAERWYRQSLEIEEPLGNRPGVASSYHQLGRVAQLRGDLSSAERWYRQALAIDESLGDRPGMAGSYGQLGLVAEARGRKGQALEWMVRCVALFSELPHPLTGPGPDHLARLTGELGFGALDAAWRKVTGEELPEGVRAWVVGRLAEGG